MQPNPNAPQGSQGLDGVRMRVGNAGATEAVIIETAGAVMNPMVALRLEVGCDSPLTRDFLVLGEGARVPGIPEAIARAPVVEPVTTQVEPTQQPPVRAPVARAKPRVALAPPGATVPPVPAIPQPAAPRADRIPVPGAIPPAAVTPPAPPQPAAKAPAISPRAADAVQAVPPVPVAADSETSRRLNELRARSDDHVASLLALEDRLALLQKQAELLKAQLEYALASAQPTAGALSAPAPASAAAPTAESKPAVAKAAPSAPTQSATTTTPRKEQGVLSLITDWRVAAGGLAVLLIGAMAFKLRRRSSSASATSKQASSFKPSATSTWVNDSKALSLGEPLPSIEENLKTVEFQAAPSAAAVLETDEWEAVARAAGVEQTAEWVPPPTTDTLPVPEPARVEAQKSTATQSGSISREFHITQQFQPVAERVVALSSSEEIVQQARTHYMDDGDLFKAIDLLEMAVSARKDSNRPWQALFAIYHRENMPERYQRLALAYRGAFGQDSSWQAIRALGRAIDATNPMFAEELGDALLPEDLMERWLGVPLDFTAHLLANEMHDQLMYTFPGQRRKRKRAGE